MQSLPNAELARGQLRRLLAHPLFANSKRYPVLLAYTVEQALLGNAGELKERTIGVEAFGREPDYDVNLDPVVRTTAAEVRKRLIQYYYNPDHAGELVIELPVGAYVPSFREPATPQNGSAVESGSGQTIETSPRDPVIPAANAEPARSGLTVRHWISIAAALLVAAFIGFGVGHGSGVPNAPIFGVLGWRFPGQPASHSTQSPSSPRPPSNLERFWQPITATSSQVTYCLGEPVPVRPVDRQHTAADGSPLATLHVSDVITLARSIAPLVSRHSALRVLAASETGFTQLREGPFVLIGAFDNSWTMRITQDLPFGFEFGDHISRIVDRKSAQKRSWSLQSPIPVEQLTQDYAIVARIHDGVTGQPVIILAGILGEGTEAAGEVVSNPVYLEALLQKVPKNWDQMNLEAVIETHVIDGHPGPPTIIAVETW